MKFDTIQDFLHLHYGQEQNDTSTQRKGSDEMNIIYMHEEKESNGITRRYAVKDERSWAQLPGISGLSKTPCVTFLESQPISYLIFSDKASRKHIVNY